MPASIERSLKLVVCLSVCTRICILYVRMYLYSRACLYRWCKSFLLFHVHLWEKTALQRLSGRHSLTLLGSWHRQVSKEPVQVLEATVFLCLHATHNLAGSSSMSSARSQLPQHPVLIKKILIINAGVLILLVIVQICSRLLDLWLQHVCITVCSMKSCLQFRYIPVCTSTNLVYTCI